MMKSGLMFAFASYLIACKAYVYLIFYGWYEAGLLYVASSLTQTTEELNIIILLLANLFASYLRLDLVA